MCLGRGWSVWSIDLNQERCYVAGSKDWLNRLLLQGNGQYSTAQQELCKEEKARQVMFVCGQKI